MPIAAQKSKNPSLSSDLSPYKCCCFLFAHQIKGRPVAAGFSPFLRELVDILLQIPGECLCCICSSAANSR